LGFLEILKLFQTRQLRKAQDGAGIFNENTITMREKIKKAIQKAKIESIDEIPYVSKERSSLSPSPTKKVQTSSYFFFNYTGEKSFRSNCI